MPAPKTTAGGAIGGLIGVLGLSAVAGLLVTVMVAPFVAVTGVAAHSGVAVFDQLPEYINIDTGNQVNRFVVTGGKKTEENPNGYVTVATKYDQNRQEIPLSEMSQFLVDAAIAGEDRRFYEHSGVDAPSVVRATVGQILGTSSSGASTLEMQTVRNFKQQEIYSRYLDKDITYDQMTQELRDALAPDPKRKIEEMKYAIGLDKRFTKDEILAMYLNVVNFGGNTYGVQSAAQQYFGKKAKDVTLAEAASLLATVQNPVKLNLGNPENYERNQARRDEILYDMLETGKITDEQYDEARAVQVDEGFIHPADPDNGCLVAEEAYRFVCDYAYRVARSELETLGADKDAREAAFKKGGYTFVLTINQALQKIAVATAQQWAPRSESRFQLGAAVTSVQVGTGAILSMGQNWVFDDRESADGTRGRTSINFAADLAHGGGLGYQPGSTWKPYVLLAFLAAGHGVNETFNASIRDINQSAFPNCTGSFPNRNYHFRNDAGEGGLWTVRRATGNSVNSVFLQMATKVDQCDIIKMAQSLGVHNAYGPADGSDMQSKSDPTCAVGGCSINVSPLMQAAAYAAIANRGVYCEPYIIRKVIGPDGTELPGQTGNCSQSLASPKVADAAAYAMETVMHATAGASNPNDGTQYIGKTGTTNDAYDTWMVGTSTKVATAVWVGNVVTNQNSKKQNLRAIYLKGVQAAVLRHRIFHQYVLSVDKRFKGTNFPAPDPSMLIGSPVIIPDGLIGQTLNAAKQAIELNELSFKNAGTIDSDLDAGLVAKVSPASGAQVPRGTQVQVWVSNGQGARVPDVISTPMSFDEARQVFNDAGFMNVSAVCANDPDPDDDVLYAPGTVVAQDPKAKTVRNKTYPVKLSVMQVMPCPPNP